MAFHPSDDGSIARDGTGRLPTLCPLRRAVADCRRHAGRAHREQNAVRARAGTSEGLVGAERTAIHRDHHGRDRPRRAVLPRTAGRAFGGHGGGRSRSSGQDVIGSAGEGAFPRRVRDVEALAEYRALFGEPRPPPRRSRVRAARSGARHSARGPQRSRVRKDARGDAAQRLSRRSGGRTGRSRRMEFHFLPLRHAGASRTLGLAALRPPFEPQLLRARRPDGAHPLLHGGGAGPRRCRAACGDRPVRGRRTQGSRPDALACARHAGPGDRLALDEKRGPPSRPMALRRPSPSGRRAPGQPDRALRGPAPATRCRPGRNAICSIWSSALSNRFRRRP